MEQIELSFQSRGLINVVTEQLPRLAVEETAKLLVEIEPSSAGEYPLYCALKVRSGEQIKNYLGVRPLRVNAAPDTPATPVNPCDIRTNRGDRQSEFLGSESGPTPFASLLAANPLRNLHDLLNLKLPECYEPVENLVLDSTVPQRVVEDLEAQKSDALLIPRLLLGHVQAGTLLKLTPAYPDTRAVHLVARPQFKVGRKRDEVDLVAWFWPRSMVNDERTRHISKVHVIAECQNGRLFLRDTGSLGGSSFDGKPLAPDKLEPLNRRAALVLASEYYLDVQPMDSYYSGEPVIKNLRAWNGPATGPPPLRRGSLRFAPIGTELAFHDAVWLFSDAAFGTSRANALVLDLAGLAEVQGRFLYYRGCFWLENRVANDAVHINFINLAANEIAPLMTGQFIQLGQINFQVEVLA